MTEKIGETKRQHYVPKMLLRRFSDDGKRISLICDGRRIDNASLRMQCQEAYFYGTDQGMEATFAAEEGKLAEFLRHLVPCRETQLNPDEKRHLREWILMQRYRTRGAVDALNGMVDTVFDDVRAEYLARRGDAPPSEEVLNRLDPHRAATNSDPSWYGLQVRPVVEDMDVKLIVPSGMARFVVADHPVVFCNQFSEHHPVLGRCLVSTGPAAKGLQIYMPLSPRLMAVVFDPSTYDYGGRSSVCHAGDKDVANLNRMQAVNARSSFYFSSQASDEKHLEELSLTRQRHPDMSRSRVSKGPRVPTGGQKERQTITSIPTELKLGIKLSFIRVLDALPYSEYSGAMFVPIRSAALFRKSLQYGEIMEAEYQRRLAAARRGE